jgi:hypothetical protein
MWKKLFLCIAVCGFCGVTLWLILLRRQRRARLSCRWAEETIRVNV